MRTCDCGTCQADAVAVVKYTKLNQETCTKAACSKYHADQLTDELGAQGHTLTWMPMPRTAAPDWLAQ